MHLLIDAGAANLAFIVLRRPKAPAWTATSISIQLDNVCIGCVAAQKLNSSEQRSLMETRAALFGFAFQRSVRLSCSAAQDGCQNKTHFQHGDHALFAIVTRTRR
jgi:hypothetical protein